MPLYAPSFPRRFNYQTGQYTPPGVLTPPAPGTTFAREAAPLGGLTTTGGPVSTTAVRLAAAPGVQFGATRGPAILAPPDPSAGAAVLAAARQNGNAGANAPLGKVGNPILDVPTTLGTTAYPGGGFATTGGVVNPNGPDDGGTGIYENGVAVTKGANGVFKGAPGTRQSLLADAATANRAPGSLPAATGPTPVDQFAQDQQTIAALYPDVGKAGTDANKKYVQAYLNGYTGKTLDGKDFTHTAGNKATALDLANQLFAGTSTEAPLEGKAADEARVAQVAKDQARVAALPPPPSAGTQAANRLTETTGGALTSARNGVTNAVQNTADFFRGLVGAAPIDRKALAADAAANAAYMNDASDAPPSLAPPKPSVIPSGYQPTGPLSNTTPPATAAPAVPVAGASTPSILAPPATGNAFAPQPLTLNGTSNAVPKSVLSPPTVDPSDPDGSAARNSALNDPTLNPLLSDDEIKRRRQASTATP